MDEFAKLPKIDAVLEGPDLGRSKQTYYFLIAQDYGQIGKIYSKEDQQLINGTTGIKLVLAPEQPRIRQGHLRNGRQDHRRTHHRLAPVRPLQGRRTVRRQRLQAARGRQPPLHRRRRPHAPRHPT